MGRRREGGCGPIAIISIAVGDNVLSDGIYIGGRHCTCCFRELTDDCNLIGRFRDVIRDQELMMISRSGVRTSTKRLLKVSQLHFM